MAPKSMRAIISSRELLPTAWIWSGISVPLLRVSEWMRRGVGLEGWCEDSWVTTCLVFSSLAMDCEVNISLVDPMVLVSNTKILIVEWGMGVTVDSPKNPLQPFPTPQPAHPQGHECTC